MAEMKNLTINGEQFVLPFAPAGYGLGDSWNLATDFNTALTNGWWYGASASGTVNFPAGFTANCACFVVARGANQIYQYFFYPTNGCVVQRYTKDGGATWEEEWVNPPMLPGVEYRTTERWNGEVVYRKLLVYTHSVSMSAKTSLNIPHGISNLNKIINTNGYSHSMYPIPYIASDGHAGFSQWDSTYITFYSDTFWGVGGTLNIDIKYTKK